MDDTSCVNSDKKMVDHSQLLAAVNVLLESLSDKDESVRHSVESSLIRMAEKHPNDVLRIVCEFKQKNPKIGDQPTGIVLRVIESLATMHTQQLNEDTRSKVIELAVNEIIKTHDHYPLIQKPCQEILVSIGRQYCAEVMEALSKQLQQGQVAHFMILHCMGTLATANVNGIIPFIKSTLSIILPTLGMIKPDYVKQSYAFALGRFSEAVTEHLTQDEQKSNNEDTFGTEIAIAYEVFLHQWLPNREPKVSADILHSLAHMYPLLPPEKIREQVTKVITHLLGFYRRSIDRNAITQMMASVLKTTIESDPKLLEPLSDMLIMSLFDLVCVNPDYEKPQTVKGHYEVLRCFDLLSDIHGERVLNMLLAQLRSNNERDRIKSLLVLTHLVNSASTLVSLKTDDFITMLKTLVQTEKSIKLKMVLLKTVVAFAEKGFIRDKEFIKFIVRHCCPYAKSNAENGTADEHTDFVQACNNSMFILATTVGTIDIPLKQELLHFYLIMDYSEAASTIAKCLANLFSKSTDITNGEIETKKEDDQALVVPSAKAVFVRSLILMGNPTKTTRTYNILSFLKHYCTVLNKHLTPLWTEKLTEMGLHVEREVFAEKIFDFLCATIKDVDSTQFAEDLVNKASDQLSLYPIVHPASEFRMPSFGHERGMLLKVIGICLCGVTDNQTVESKIDLILNAARLEKIEKHSPNSEYDLPATDAARALGYISRTHLNILLKKMEALILEGGTRKSNGGFFSGLHFIKDSHKETEMLKVTLLVVEAYGYIVQNAPQNLVLQDIDERMVQYLCKQLSETKEFTVKKLVLNTLLTICQQMLQASELSLELKSRSEIVKQILKIPIESMHDNMPLFPIVLKLATILIKVPSTTGNLDTNECLEISCFNFFISAQQLKTKFDSPEDDERNSYLAKYLNLSLPELNFFVKTILEQDSSPASLDDVNHILEKWVRDKNSEVRICAGHVMNSALEVYIKTVKIGCEAPSKFNQTGVMLGKIVPRCIDSNATVRQTSVDILRKILEISCIYETLTIADAKTEWVKELQKIRDEIVTDDPKEIYRIAGDVARIISVRLSNFQYLNFCKTLLQSLDDPEQSSSIGSSVVLKFFTQIKGSELFHAIPDLVKESLAVVQKCEIVRARSGVLKSIVALTRHHPKLVSTEMLSQPLPFESNVVEFWKLVSGDPELSGIVIDNFLSILSSSCLFESQGDGDRQKVATAQPFAILCTLNILMAYKDIQGELKKRFPELFSMLLTYLATFTNLAPPMTMVRHTSAKGDGSKSNKNKFGFIPNKDSVKMNPCQIVIETFQAFLDNLEMEQISAVLSVCPQLSTSSDLSNFIEILTPMAVGLANQLSVSSSAIKQVVTTMSRYVSSPYDSQRIASIGLYSQLVPLKPCGEISSVILLHLNSALADPDPLVRGLAIRGLAFVGNLTEHDIEKYAEMSLSALLKGVDDYNSDCVINIPLESMRGLSRILKALPGDKLETFQVSLAIRIKPFFENVFEEIREAAILLFGDVCQSKIASHEEMFGTEAEIQTPDALREQLFSNFFSLLLHLSETNSMIVRACKITLRKVCTLINAPKCNAMVQSHLLEYGQLQYDAFIVDFIKVIAEELNDKIPDFIESCVPFLKSHWPEIRGNSAIVVGLLHNYNTNNRHHTENISQKISVLMRDESTSVKLKAATALGFMFGDL